MQIKLLDIGSPDLQSNILGESIEHIGPNLGIDIELSIYCIEF